MSGKILLDPKWDPHSKPVYEDYFDYYLFGFVGHPSVNLQKVCMDQKPYAVRYFHGIDDGLIAFLTLGIYTPGTVRVWCGD